MKDDINLNITEELDFHYLLTLMPALRGIPQFAWLPELFSIIGHERLVELCKHAGGETITIPTLDELMDSIDSLQYFYDAYISKKISVTDIPDRYKKPVCEIWSTYARNDKT